MRSIVFIQRQLRTLATAGALTLVVAMPCPLVAQTGKSQPASATAADPFAIPPGVKRVPVSKAPFGDAGMIVNARDDGFIEIAAAGPQKTIYLQLRTVAARGWVDSTLRMMKARVKKADPPRAYRSAIQEYATGSEFRTAPLWGVRASAPYLHDGRAATLVDAISAHGGEATESRDRFLALDPAQVTALVAYLESL